MLVKMPWAVPMVLRSPEGDAGGAGGGGSGGAGDDQSGNSGSQDDKSKVVPLSTHKETLEKFHSTNTKLKETETKLSQLQQEFEKIKNDKANANRENLENSGNFKELYTQVKSENETLKNQNAEFKKSVFNNERIRTLESELKAIGLKPGNESVIDFAELEKMPVEATSRGRILVHGAKEIAADLQKKYGFAFGKPTPPKINGGGGGDDEAVHSEISDDTLTAAYMVEMETKDPKKYKELYPRFVKLWKQRNAQT